MLLYFFTFSSGESIWSRPYGPVAQALNTEIPEPEVVSGILLLTSNKEKTKKKKKKKNVI